MLIKYAKKDEKKIFFCKSQYRMRNFHGFHLVQYVALAWVMLSRSQYWMCAEPTVRKGFPQAHLLISAKWFGSYSFDHVLCRFYLVLLFLETSLALDFQMKWPFSQIEEHDQKKCKPHNFQLEIFKYKIRCLHWCFIFWTLLSMSFDWFLLLQGIN